ncbi:hypothetical protein [Flavicella sp.]|uniref:hypothetical protein n=1 Tax=Flavicella sp. TaxID=2957742 RepID=UPI003015F88E
MQIAFKTKQEYWVDSPLEGIITIEKFSLAIAEIEWNNHRKEESKRGFSRKRGLYKGAFITNQDRCKVHDKNKDPNLGFISLFVSLLRCIFKP